MEYPIHNPFSPNSRLKPSQIERGIPIQNYAITANGATFGYQPHAVTVPTNEYQQANVESAASGKV